MKFHETSEIISRFEKTWNFDSLDERGHPGASEAQGEGCEAVDEGYLGDPKP